MQRILKWFCISVLLTFGVTTTVFAEQYAYNSSNGNIRADYIPNAYEITFNANGGSCDTTSKTVTYDAVLGSLPTASLTDYSFTGWFTSITGGTQYTESTEYTTAGPMTLYAHYVKLHYVTVNHDENISSASGSGYYAVGSTVSISASPKTYYHISGYSGDYSTASFTMPDNDVTITVLSAPDKYTITYNVSYPTSNTYNGNSTTYYAYAGAVISPAECKGYNFNGWTGSNGSSAQQVVMIPAGTTGNLTYNGSFTAKGTFVATTYQLHASGYDSTSMTQYPSSSHWAGQYIYYCSPQNTRYYGDGHVLYTCGAGSVWVFYHTAPPVGSTWNCYMLCSDGCWPDGNGGTITWKIYPIT